MTAVILTHSMSVPVFRAPSAQLARGADEGFVRTMAGQEHDLLTKISPFLDKHLLFPLLEHVQSLNVSDLLCHFPQNWSPGLCRRRC